MTNHDFNRVRAVKKEAEGRLLGIPGVHCVALGAKFVGGQPTFVPAIMVFVEKKKHVTEMLPYEIIPTEVDGVKTDVFELAPPYLLADKTRHLPRDGGSPISTGGSLAGGGTLGCIARTNEPVPRIVGLTNQHCVGIPESSARTTLKTNFNLPEPLSGVIFEGANRPGTIIIADWSLREKNDVGPKNFAFYATKAEDTLEKIAVGIADAITSVAAGIIATPQGPQVTLTASAGGNFDYNVDVYGPHGFYTFADLHATIAGQEITLSGKASDNYGIFTNWNVGGRVPTRGVYTPVVKGRELRLIAQDIAAAINSRNLPGIVATPTDSKVSIAGVQQVECDVSSDVRVGQPNACFVSECCACCRDFIGVVTDARIDLDIALIALAPGLQYLAEIKDIGFITGTRTYKLEDFFEEKEDGSPDPEAPRKIPVKKSGSTTGVTDGFLLGLDGFGVVKGAHHDEPHFHRLFDQALVIQSASNLKEGFSQPGDSGSAVVNGAHEVVGILFGGNTLATPIAPIESAFNLSVVTATVKNAVNTVPVIQGNLMAAIKPRPLFVDQLRAAGEELSARPGGRKLAELGREHADEVVHLVNHNRRVGTVWRRNGGPEIFQAAMAMAESAEKVLPIQINGRPLAECLRRMQKILTRYGSAKLAFDLSRYAPRVIELLNLDYPRFLTALDGDL